MNDNFDDPDMNAELEALSNNTREKFLEHKYKQLLRNNPLYKDLKDKLLSVGGKLIVPQFEPHIEELLQCGKTFKDKKPIQYVCATASEESKYGLRRYSSECHTNISYDFVRFCGDGFKIVTGWALCYFDGDWRQHTWGLWKGHVVESTVKRRLYFGIELNTGDAVNFVFSNAPDILHGKELGLIKEAKHFNKLVKNIIKKSK